MSAGRPSDYSTEKAADICARMLNRHADGRLYSLRDICRDPDMPCESTVYLWLSKYPEFSDMYTRAREDRAHMAADEILSIADEEEDPAKARVRIDARKWYAGKLSAKHYGDKVTHSGDPNAPMTFNVITGVTRDTD